MWNLKKLVPHRQLFQIPDQRFPNENLLIAQKIPWKKREGGANSIVKQREEGKMEWEITAEDQRRRGERRAEAPRSRRFRRRRRRWRLPKQPRDIFLPLFLSPLTEEQTTTLRVSGVLFNANEINYCGQVCFSLICICEIYKQKESMLT